MSKTLTKEDKEWINMGLVLLTNMILSEAEEKRQESRSKNAGQYIVVEQSRIDKECLQQTNRVKALMEKVKRL